jgi:hypothetical protein
MHDLGVADTLEDDVVVFRSCSPCCLRSRGFDAGLPRQIARSGLARRNMSNECRPDFPHVELNGSSLFSLRSHWKSNRSESRCGNED